ncbi:MAG TPA: GDSL-type esterase/lipase family protein [Phenylobacterium sp.]|uniref:GDSL-type esterase/lipase family protein n=1 Tax=Phenylobacterium sp. TaxID=1871053 RepID=UPI002B49F707|nr:GDSL-type esterase/lipase family protein [Phenylobacterium sp.]HKR88832.1 GDSL-type esterase/lipase family protein [Phenylobacterium sp.]
MRLIAFGESFVAGVGDPDHLGWVGRALAGRRAVTLYNLGVRGATSTKLASLWRREAEARLSDEEPCRIVFSFGVNDTWHAAGEARVTPAQSLLNARAMLTEAASLCPVLLVGPPPIPDAGRQARIEALNENFKLLCARLQVPFIDVFRPLAADGLWVCEAAAWDGAHPGAAGYQRMADLIAAHPLWRAFTLAE